MSLSGYCVPSRWLLCRTALQSIRSRNSGVCMDICPWPCHERILKRASALGGPTDLGRMHIFCFYYHLQRKTHRIDDVYSSHIEAIIGLLSKLPPSRWVYLYLNWQPCSILSLLAPSEQDSCPREREANQHAVRRQRYHTVVQSEDYFFNRDSVSIGL